jgi:hypothetical protein
MAASVKAWHESTMCAGLACEWLISLALIEHEYIGLVVRDFEGVAQEP